MKRRAYALQDVERMVPLLRSIGREIKARHRAAESILKRLETQRARPRRSNEDRTHTLGLEAELATHLRETRSAEKELERLGCRLDEQHPLRILIPSPNGDWAFDGHLDETRFYVPRRPGGPRGGGAPGRRRSTSS